ncbi:MAG TPA: amidohydrolase family protein [Ktedonobacteraceae bacterium]|nr:amidohydrolase family protein [Ktedonobacteraceae bacterium]
MDQSLRRGPIIDVHRHASGPDLQVRLSSIPREVFDERLSGFIYARKDIRFQTSGLGDIDVQVQGQDRAGVTKGLLSNPFLLAELRHHVGAIAQEVAAIVNDDLAAVVAKHPRNLDFLATVHPFEPGCIEEAERGLTQLGAKGLSLSTSYAGRWLDDRTLDPFWEYVQSRDVAIFLHPPATPAWLSFNDIYRMQEMLHRPFDEMMNTTRMIYSGVFDRYPRLKIVLPHAGGGIMNLLGRLDYSYRLGFAGLPSEDAATCQRQPSAYIGTNLYVELGASFSPTTVRQALALFGSDHVLFGTDYPAVFLPIEEQIAIVTQLDTEPAIVEQILWRNASALFRLE